MSRGAEVGCGPDHIVSDGDPAPPKEHSPQFSVHVFSGQMAGRIKMPLGRAVDLGPGDIVLDGDPAHLTPKGTQPPDFRPMSVVDKRLDGSRCHLVRR